MRATVFNLTVRRRIQIVVVFVAVLLIAPICVYIYKFSWNISGDHARWSEMGSAMSGVYTPILALLTLWVLLAQVRLQGEMNKHAFDQAYVQEVRSDVQYYLSQMVVEFQSEFDDGSPIGVELVRAFAYASPEDLQAPQVVKIAQALNRKYPRLLSIWSAFYPLLEGLRVNKHSPYEHNLSAATQKAIVMLSYDGCAALDNFIWCASEGRLKYSYEFARQLSSAQSSTPSFHRSASSG